ncbi:WapI family immunity protein [Geothrix mesophila]|uniref:WapI family immunity protein n=1 Tax=Geothrix mesophila TaxID=2922723 RepID=UPI001FABB438|nr:hypothetical protein [Geothrix sp. SG198]
MKTLTIGSQEHDRLSIVVLDYERAPIGEAFDDNWLVARIEISVGSFTGTFPLCLTPQDFESFISPMEQLYKSLTGQAKFETIEGQIEVSLTGDGRGGIEVAGHALDRAGIGNRLEFGFTIDQTYFPPMLRQLRDIVTEFPTRGA